MINNVIRVMHQAKFVLNENSSTILTGVGVVGTTATAILSGQASFKAAKILEKARIDQQDYDSIAGPDLKRSTKVLLVWRLYLPAFGTGVTTVAAIVVANRIDSKRIAALVVASGISERALQEYKSKVIEKLGEKQDTKIRDEIAQDRVSMKPVPAGEVIIAGNGDVLCFDMLTGRYFMSTVEDIKRAENKVNYQIMNYLDASLSEFYDELGLPATTFTDQVGWQANQRVEVKLSTVMSPDNRPCIAIDFATPPNSAYGSRVFEAT